MGSQIRHLGCFGILLCCSIETGLESVPLEGPQEYADPPPQVKSSPTLPLEVAMDLHAHALSELAQLIATDPEPAVIAAHLRAIALADLKAEVVTTYLRVQSDEGESLILVGAAGLTEEEEARYANIDADFPMPAAEAIQHTFPYSLTGQEITERYPLMFIRPELIPHLTMLILPLNSQGATVGATIATLRAPMTWSPEVLSYTLGLQALLGLQLRITDRMWSPIRPLSPDLTVFQGLTARQRSILQLVSMGKSTSSIAARLGFSPATIKQDLRRAMVVLDVSDRQSAVQRSIEFGLIPAP